MSKIQSEMFKKTELTPRERAIFSACGSLGIDIKDPKYKGPEKITLSAQELRFHSEIKKVKVYKNSYECKCGRNSNIRFVRRHDNGKESNRCAECSKLTATCDELVCINAFMRLQEGFRPFRTDKPLDLTDKSTLHLLEEFGVNNDPAKVEKFIKYGNSMTHGEKKKEAMIATLDDAQIDDLL